MTALSFDDEREIDRRILDGLDNLYVRFKENGILSPLTDDFEGYLYGDINLPATSLRFDFGLQKFIDLSKLIMCHGG
ncbi:hypothetical protein K788_00011765 [Paraburkholderia caribensis MBA4]|uniref:Uncharacterized protein n=1 Tax=Paraburkholderia caribensis MBA4 TaxID=1323664 RepID=A0A0P0R8P5_9BURK|nr:hypothetical protein K788_00011765 [Paraburkholderia caribensis MBA4]